MGVAVAAGLFLDRKSLAVTRRENDQFPFHVAHVRRSIPTSADGARETQVRETAVGIRSGSGAAPPLVWHPVLDRPASFGLLTVFGATMVPVMFAYGGWQTSNFIASEVRDPRRNMPRALLLGVLGVIALYVSVNYIYVRALGPVGLAAIKTPASEVMRRAMGATGSAIIAVAIAASTLGFLSNAMLTYPRVYFAMADDKIFPRVFAQVSSRTRVPVWSIALQGALTTTVALLGTYVAAKSSPQRAEPPR